MTGAADDSARDSNIYELVLVSPALSAFRKAKITAGSLRTLAFALLPNSIARLHYAESLNSSVRNLMRGTVLLIALSAALFGIGLASAKDPAARKYEVGKSFQDCRDICPEMIALAPGAFLMGSTTTDKHQGAGGEEQPQHRVSIGYAFAVGEFEVTRDQYARFVQETGIKDPQGCNVHEPPHWPTIMGLNWHNPGFAQTGRDPVVCVSWKEADAYTHWLSKRTGQSYRLLSEAEWEYAARAGTTTQAYWGDRQEDACGYANGVDLTLVERFPNAAWENIVQCHDGRIFTAPVGSFKPNGYGLYDMEGNVFEWVTDCWAKNYEGAPTDGAPRLDGDCGHRVNRGGSWTSAPTGLRSTHRDEDDAERTRVVDLGFRVARNL